MTKIILFRSCKMQIDCHYIHNSHVTISTVSDFHMGSTIPYFLFVYVVFSIIILQLGLSSFDLS